jgi:large subunit ribosomal protein L4
MATAAPSPILTSPDDLPPWHPDATVPLTIHAIPSMEPISRESWRGQHLNLPMRNDILHTAVTYEGRGHRQGTASTKTPWEVAGSHAKKRRQKGSGKARLGWKQSPAIRGGGVMFGPKPRDWSTAINRKVYDLAWRTALSYRYRRGELLVVQDGLDLPLPDDFLDLAARGRLERELEDGFVARYVRELLGPLRWGRRFGRTTFVASEHRPNLFTGMACAHEDARAIEVADVDVKDLLETGRLVVERQALQWMVERHQSDLINNIVFFGEREPRPKAGSEIVGDSSRGLDVEEEE